jgi:hypothetical protein
MALNRFRVATAILILFNVLGAVVTWTVHLSKPGTSAGDAILGGTEFTAPLILIVLWIGFLVMMSKTGRVASVGLWLMTAFAAVFAFGDVTELFKKNIGVSASKWHSILALTGISLALGLAVAVLGIIAIASALRAPPSTKLVTSGS